MKSITRLARCQIILLLFSFHLFADVSVTITEPTAGAVVTPCQDILVKFAVTATAGEKVKHIYLYSNGLTKGRVRTEPWEFLWKAIPKGVYELTAKLVTQDEIEVWSDPVLFKAGNISLGERLNNGGFDCGTTVPWRPNVNGSGQATFTVYDDHYFDDAYYLAVDIDNVGADRWSVQLFQVCPLDSGHTYEVSFLADAPEKKTIYIGMQEGQEPWASQFGQEIEIDGANLYGPMEFIATKTDPTNDLVFHFGSDQTSVFLDNVQVIDRSATSVKSQELRFDQGVISEYELFQAYPNPFNMNTTIRFKLSTPSRITLDVYSMTGQKVITLCNDYKSDGQHAIIWNGVDDFGHIAPTGVYIYRLSVDDGSRRQEFSRKVLLLK